MANETGESLHMDTVLSGDISTDNSNLRNFDFSGIPGLKAVMDSDEPINCFNLFFTDNVHKNIISATNEYAEEFFFLAKYKRTRITEWKLVDIPIMNVF